MEIDFQRVDVWSAPLAADPEALAEHERTISTDEHERAARFLRPASRDAYVAGRATVRRILGAYVQRDPSDVQFGYAPSGKPFVRRIHGDPPVSFNVSHSRDLLVLAVSGGRSVGVDVEATPPRRGVALIADRYFTDRERAELAAVAPDARDEAFLRYWTRKEACVKALGDGLARSLRSFAVSPRAGERELIEIDGQRRWTAYGLAPSPEYTGAVVAEGEGWALALRRWGPDGASGVPRASW